MNPLTPGPSDVLWSVATVVNAILVVAALISLARAADKRRWLSTVLLIVFVPIAGPIVSISETRGRRIAPARSAEHDKALIS